MGIKINTPRPTAVLETPAQRLTQGNRTVYYFGLSIAQFDDAAPEEVDAKVIRESQRRFIPSHAKSIEGYLQDTDKWVLGPVTLCIDPYYVEFEPYPGQPRDAATVLGLLKVNMGGRPFLKILDGQHRRRAIRSYRTTEPIDTKAKERLDRFEQCQMPVALYEEADTTSIRQMFADMAQQRRMDAVTKSRFDMRDPFNKAADILMGESEWIGQYVEMNTSTVARTSTKLVAFNQLAVNLKTLQVGYYGRTSRIRLQEAALDVDGIVERGKQWTDEFLPSAREEYLELLSQDIDPDYIPTQRPKTLAYNGTMLRILAGCHYEWQARYPQRKPDSLADFVNEMNLDPHQQGGLLFDTGVINLQRTILVARRQEVQDTIKAIVDGANERAANN